MNISVVIPAYNEELFLPRLLDSLKNQDFSGSFEIIVVDNNSTDKTAAIAKSYGARVLKERKQGYAFTCNRGFNQAKGKIIAHADADYVVSKSWLKNIYESFEKDSKLIALAGPLYPLESNFFENLFYYPVSLIWTYTLKFLGRGFFWPNMAVRKTIFRKTGGWNTKIVMGEDQEMCLQLKRLGKVKFVPGAYVYTSLRRLRALGLAGYILGYSFGNQINLLLGTEKFVGLDPVRELPVHPPQPQKPWLFVYAMPSLVIVLLFSLIFLYYAQPAQAEVLKKKSQKTFVNLGKKVTLLKKQIADKQLFTNPVPSN